MIDGTRQRGLLWCGELSQWAYKHRMTVLLIHQQRKGKTEDIIDSALGSTGVGGTIDSILASLRPNRAAKAAMINGLGRSFKEDLNLNIQQLDIGTWELQDRRNIGLTPVKQAILDLLREKGPLSAKTIAEMLGKGLDGMWRQPAALHTNCVHLFMCPEGGPSGVRTSQALGGEPP
jgi:hypothetical protein